MIKFAQPRAVMIEQKGQFIKADWDGARVKKIGLLITFCSAIFLLLSFPVLAYAAVDAESVVTGKCTACHMADRIREASMSEQEWANRVDKEIERGADLNREERAAAIDWLAQNFGTVQVAQAEPPSTSQVQGSETTESLPFNEQAHTGVELWHFLLSGGALFSTGVALRRHRS